MSVCLLLRNGGHTLIDAEDYERVIAQGVWTAYRPNKKYGDLYVYSTKRKNRALHRFLTEAPEGFVVDHINGDTLDNRRSNLRVCTHVDNLRKAKLSKRNTTGVKGVSLTNRGYFAKIGNTYIGYYPTLEEAATARRAAEQSLWGAA